MIMVAFCVICETDKLAVTSKKSCFLTHLWIFFPGPEFVEEHESAKSRWYRQYNYGLWISGYSRSQPTIHEESSTLIPFGSAQTWNKSQMSNDKFTTMFLSSHKSRFSLPAKRNFPLFSWSIPDCGGNVKTLCAKKAACSTDEFFQLAPHHLHLRFENPKVWEKQIKIQWFLKVNVLSHIFPLSIATSI